MVLGAKVFFVSSAMKSPINRRDEGCFPAA
jgi:hypothetical protein